MTQQLVQQRSLGIQLARFCYVAKGIVYGIVELLAAQTFDMVRILFKKGNV